MFITWSKGKLTKGWFRKFWIKDSFTFLRWFFSLNRELDIMPQIQNGEWHGLCVTWNKDDGHFLIYYDGRLIRSESGLKSGKSFPSNNTFTLGIGAEEKFNYTGMLGHVNIWSRVLEHPLLSALSSKCGVERGGLVSWPRFQEDLRGVNVGESCSFHGEGKHS